jgi:citrate lyase subunit beta/citryl-CoA lyase
MHSGVILTIHMDSLAPRSYLFVPGNRPERYAKAIAAGADAVIVDLEDAVPPKDKPSARTALAAWLSPERPVLIRINGSESQWFREDIALCGTPGVAGVLLPKAERVEDIRVVAEHCGAATPILPLIETARGFWNAHALAQGPKVQRFVFGSIDFQLDL